MYERKKVMYKREFLTVVQMMEYLGLGRNRVLRLCQEHTHNFPAVRVGNRYQSELSRLEQWYNDWYEGKFSIDD